MKEDGVEIIGDEREKPKTLSHRLFLDDLEY
jgi:hypothetical protein